ncbi:4a-hydroxytetrahydrobiopterin dehydratase [Paramicrobacterium sp. CJ85]|uniref:4a-hydroxytetrahydrobiopterin dehydratase n=1 Tax=Paramicrobacterium sp. CJ85 TaxID=3445355 RepID=UPI003F60E8DB
MVERISAERFAAESGVEDWHADDDHARARFNTGSFAKGVEFVVEIGKLAEEANHHPDVDLRYPNVTVTLSTHDVSGLSQRDIDLATQISVAARNLEIPTE